MAYIDKEKTIEAIRYKHKPLIPTGSLADVLCNSIEETIAEQPTADVAPKSESEFDSIPVEAAQALKEKAVEKAKAEVAREIFEEIERYVIKGISVGGEHLTLFNGKNYAELKKKYTEEKL